MWTWRVEFRQSGLEPLLLTLVDCVEANGTKCRKKLQPQPGPIRVHGARLQAIGDGILLNESWLEFCERRHLLDFGFGLGLLRAAGEQEPLAVLRPPLGARLRGRRGHLAVPEALAIWRSRALDIAAIDV